MNPLDWKGPEFLALYAPLLIVSILVGALLRWWLRQPGGPPEALLPAAYEAALLRGKQALVEAALASLAHQGRIRMEGGRLVASGRVPFTAPLIERIVHAGVEAGEVRPAELTRKAEPAVNQLRVTLVERGWLVDDTWGLRARLLPLLPGLAVLLMGQAKLLVGLQRGRPVTGLVFVSLLWLGLALPLLARAPWRSRLGDATLMRLRAEQETLRQTASAATSGATLNSVDVALAVGLFGLTAVGFQELEDLRRHLQASGYSSSGGSSSDGSSGCGGGDGGGGDGGGGGGGGCGGCGGGGD